MPRLSDRAFHIVRTEIERRYTDDPTDQIERVILLARLEALRVKKGAPMTRIQIWEVLSDVAPNFDQNVLMDAESVETDSPLLGVSVGIGAVAVLVATAIGMDSLTPRPALTQDAIDSAQLSDAESANRRANADGSVENATSQGLTQSANQAAVETTKTRTARPSFRPESSKQDSPQQKTTSKTTTEQPTPEAAVKPRSLKARFVEFINRAPRDSNRTQSRSEKRSDNSYASDKHIESFESAKAIGWQAALRSQNPPHSAQHWKETAKLWQKAIAQLAEIPPKSPHYIQAQQKKTLYQVNLKEIQDRQAAAEQTAKQAARAAVRSVTQVVSTGASRNVNTAQPSSNSAPAFSSESTGAQTQRSKDPIQSAKAYGWQAALASQNAPHPPEKWADISRLWQTALSSLKELEPEHPRYAEAQQIKAVYQQNLVAIRERYQREQSAAQRLQSLQASLRELNNSLTPNPVKYGRMEAIVSKLRTIPEGTEAHQQAQSLIADTADKMNAIAVAPEQSTQQ